MPDVRIYSEEETVIGMFLSDGRMAVISGNGEEPQALVDWFKEHAAEYGVNPEEETWEEIPV